MANHTWRVGQKVFVTYRYRRDPNEFLIVSIGRKWATLEGRAGRFNLATGWLDNSEYLSSPGRVWESRAAYDEHTSVEMAWSKLRLRIILDRDAPAGLTLGAIQTAREMLFGAEVRRG